MASAKNTQGALVTRQNISYYNGIATSYDDILQKDEANAVIRSKVADAFTRLVKRSSRVMDFGGGTGQDLGWLLQRDYHIYFCEPSAAMRTLAIEKIKNVKADVSFLSDQQADFRNWPAGFAFEQPVDAILADFAVINCIPDIKLLFQKLSLCVKRGGHVIALILDNGLQQRLRSNLKGTVKSLFSRKPVSIHVDYNGQRQLVYLHSTAAIKKATGSYFEFRHAERLQGLNFCLLHLVKK